MTAVDFLLEKITFKKLENDVYLYPRVTNVDIKQVKEIEKKQIIDAYTHNRFLLQITAEQYYNENYKKPIPVTEDELLKAGISAGIEQTEELQDEFIIKFVDWLNVNTYKYPTATTTSELLLIFKNKL